jgi:hypothetical protein
MIKGLLMWQQSVQNIKPMKSSGTYILYKKLNIGKGVISEAMETA